MKYNVLQMTQSILSAMGSDEVNSISDTTESLQVAEIIRQTYFNMMSKYNLPENNQLIQLTGSGEVGQPVLMFVPGGISRISWVKYFNTNPSSGQTVDQFGSYSHAVNTDIIPSDPAWTTTSTTSNAIGIGVKTFTVGAGLTIDADDMFVASSSNGANAIYGNVVSYVGTTLVVNSTSFVGSGTYTSWNIYENIGQFGPGYKDVKLISFESFLEMTQRLNPTDDNVESFTLSFNNQASGDLNSFTFYYRSDLQPQYCAVLSDYYVIFDSYDATQDSTLQGAKTMCLGWVLPTFELTDTFVPALNDGIFPLLLNEAKSLAFIELKQVTHAKAEQEVKRQISALQKFKAVVKRPTDFDQLANYGRRNHGWI